jgi:hypothetical protein
MIMLAAMRRRLRPAGPHHAVGNLARAQRPRCHEHRAGTAARDLGVHARTDAPVVGTARVTAREAEVDKIDWTPYTAPGADSPALPPPYGHKENGPTRTASVAPHGPDDHRVDRADGRSNGTWALGLWCPKLCVQPLTCCFASSHRAAVGGNGVGAGVSLPDEPVGEQRLQGRGECAHDRSTDRAARCASSRCPPWPSAPGRLQPDLRGHGAVSPARELPRRGLITPKSPDSASRLSSI